MPHVTGMDFYSELLVLDPEQARHVIFLTGGAFSPRARAFLDEVPNLRLEKPFDQVKLKRVVKERLR
jgi:response regulator RpfG family c-di-GMP phosphodiesterase